MSFDQPRSDKNDSAHYRKSGRSANFNDKRTSSGAYTRGSAPASSPSLSSSVATSRSFKNPGSAQGGQPRMSFPSASHHSESNKAPSVPLHNVHKGVSVQSQARGSSAASGTSRSSKSIKSNPAQTSGTQNVLKAPPSESTSMNSDSKAPKTTVKAPEDASNAFTFQFCSISPGFVNGMQSPARTASAPPNIDEQKRDQALHYSVKAVPPIPVPPAVRQRLPMKDLGSASHSSAADIHSTPKAIKDPQAQPVTPSQTQNAHVHQVPRMSMPMTYHQPQVPVKFSAPNPQIESQGMLPTPIQMHMQIPIPLPVVNAPPQVHQQMFVPGLQTHQLPSQGTLLQGQGLNFPQRPPQTGSLGMGIGQYTQQQGRFGGPFKTPVKITHPERHQEMRLDNPSDAFSDERPSGRSLPSVPQSQPITAGHKFDYYHNYNPGNLVFSGPGSLSVLGAHLTPASQASGYNGLVNPAPDNASFLNSPSNSLSASTRAGVSNQGNVEQARQEPAQNPRDGTSSTFCMMQETVKQPGGSINKNTAAVSSLRSSTAAANIEPPKVIVPFGESSNKEYEVGPRSSPKLGTAKEPSSSLSATTEWNLAGASVVSRENLEPGTSSVDYSSCEVSASFAINAEAGKRDNYSRSNSFQDRGGEQDKAEHGSFSPEISDAAISTKTADPGFKKDDGLDGKAKTVNVSRSVGQDHHPSRGRQSMVPKLDRCGIGIRADDRWAKVSGTFASGHDLLLDVRFGGNLGLRPGQGANYGVLRNLHAQRPSQYAGGILPELMQPPGPQGGMQRTGYDADRWQRATVIQQKGLIPSPQTPVQMMHKAEKKYEVGKVADEEEAKQRQLKAILNKLTTQNFEKLFKQAIAVQIDNVITLVGLVLQIFDKALMEPMFCEMYANLCSHLSQALPDFNEGDEKITFKRLLINKCQEEFERGEREQEEADKFEEEGKVEQSEVQREEEMIKARRRMLGNVRLIGELYKKRMLTEKIMHECVKRLLGQYQTPDEEDLEALCKLMSIIGEMIDHPKAKVHMDAYFERISVVKQHEYFFKNQVHVERCN